MAHLHEILAVDADRQKTAVAVQEEATATFSKKPHIFVGGTRSVKFFSETRQGENLEEAQALSDTIGGKLRYVASMIGAHYDTLLTKELSNMGATADLIVDGVVLARSLPATFLLGMEGRLRALRTIYLAIPTLDPSIVWSQDPTQGDGVWRSAPSVNMKTEKVLKHQVLVAATDKHPAQVEKWTEDSAVASITTTKFSGMVSPAEKSEMLGRLDTLISAVKQARQRANMVQVTQGKIAGKIFDWINDGLILESK